MQSILGKFIFVTTLLLALGACSQKEPQLMNLGSGDGGPDEFLIVPTKPLESPDDFSALPTPTPGGGTRTDPSPVADAVEALGGSRAQATHSSMRSSEQGVVSFASRYGVAQGIRTDLAAADLEWRRKHNGRLLERMFNVSVYFRAYEKMSLDQYLELARLRGLGIWTPAVPPDGVR